MVHGKVALVVDIQRSDILHLPSTVQNENLRKAIKEALNLTPLSLKKFQKLVGRLRHSVI